MIADNTGHALTGAILLLEALAAVAILRWQRLRSEEADDREHIVFEREKMADHEFARLAQARDTFETERGLFEIHQADFLRHVADVRSTWTAGDLAELTLRRCGLGPDDRDARHRPLELVEDTDPTPTGTPRPVLEPTGLTVDGLVADLQARRDARGS